VQTYGNPNPTYGWWAGNAGTTNRSGKFLAAHIAHTGLMAFWAGSFTLFELSRYDPSVPMGHQPLVALPHLATLGIGVGDGGVITDTYPIVVTAVLHLVLSMVYAAGGLMHSLLFNGDIGEMGVKWARKFDFKWDDPDKLTFILGHHLFLLGLGNVQFVEWAKYYGLYDNAEGVVRTVVPNLNIGMVWNAQFNFLAINSLEDVMGGHAFLALFMMSGGLWHIVTKQAGEYTTFKGKGILSAEAQLSWALAGVGWMALVAAFWCASNTTIYPDTFFGEVLDLKFSISPYWVDTANLPEGTYTSRAWLTNIHYYLGFFYIQGHLWHALRALGFDFKRVSNAIGNADSATITLN
jgi:chlorophyll a/b binding light-harvesting protein PcbA|tara:strand:+ start:140 stop:1192 length:1053 start_codon:yes stop_codon:yes gene_type:complete